MRRTSIAFALMALWSVPLLAQPRPPLSFDEEAVMRVDEQYRVAKIQNDTTALDQVLAADFSETNQNGNTRDKSQTLELWKAFRISDLTTDGFDVRVSGDTAVVKGTQTEMAAALVVAGTVPTAVRVGPGEAMLFTRVYVREAGVWRLLSSMQFRNPRPAPAARMAASAKTN